MARAKAAPPIEYHIVWNPTRKTFDVQRDSVRLGSFARDKSTAVCLAIKEAQLEANATIDRVIVTSTQNERRVVEWTSQ